MPKTISTCHFCSVEFTFNDIPSGRWKNLGKYCSRSCWSRGTNTRHGLTQSPTWRSWCSMKARCQNPQAPNFALYGGRGITVCERWQVFEAFLEDMGLRVAGTSLDRIDNDGNYEPGNCRWATNETQGRNRRTNRLVTVGDETLTLTEWSQRSGIPNSTLFQRLENGVAPEEAIATPSRPNERLISYGGKTMNLTDWATHLGLKVPTLCKRLGDGWPLEKALAGLTRAPPNYEHPQRNRRRGVRT